VGRHNRRRTAPFARGRFAFHDVRDFEETEVMSYPLLQNPIFGRNAAEAAPLLEEMYDALCKRDHADMMLDAERDPAAPLEPPPPPPTPPRTRRRRPTLAGVARQATKAGIPVARYDVRPDGTVSVAVGKPVGGTDMDDTTSPDPRWN
jgi:hypothetical protein